jgi:hypothetical protein
VADCRRGESPVAATPVVVNAAEGEPGTFKDRELLRQNPFKVLEGALISAFAVDADEVVVALKCSFEHERRTSPRRSTRSSAPGGPAVSASASWSASHQRERHDAEQPRRRVLATAARGPPTMNRRIRRAPRTHLARAADQTSTANDDLLRQQIDDLERAFQREDPAFVRRFRRLQRCETLHVLTVSFFMSVGAVLMTVGLATASVVATSLGIAAMLAVCLVDVRHRRVLRRWSRETDAP